MNCEARLIILDLAETDRQILHAHKIWRALLGPADDPELAFD